MPNTTPLGLTYPEPGDHTRLWEHFQTLATDTDDAVRSMAEVVVKEYPGTYSPSDRAWVPIACPTTKVDHGGTYISAGTQGVSVLAPCVLLLGAMVRWTNATDCRVAVGTAASQDSDDSNLWDFSNVYVASGWSVYVGAAGQLLQPQVYVRGTGKTIARAQVRAVMARPL